MKIRWTERYSLTDESDNKGRWARVGYIGKFRWKAKGHRTSFEMAWISKIQNGESSYRFGIQYRFPSQGVVVAKTEAEAKEIVEHAWKVFRRETSWWRNILNKFNRH